MSKRIPKVKKLNVKEQLENKDKQIEALKHEIHSYMNQEQAAKAPSNYLGAEVAMSTENKREAHLGRMYRIFESCLNLAKRKNLDYTGLTDDPYANFRDDKLGEFIKNNIGTYGYENLDDTMLGIVIRLGDKAARRNNIMFTGQSSVKDESLADTIKDEINYLAILLSYIESKRITKSLL